AEAERCLSLQLESGVHGFILAEQLGEGQSLDMLERTELLKSALRVTAGRIPVLMTVWSTTTREACLFAEASARYGATGLLLMPPLAYRSDPLETEAHCRAIARASGIPIMICNDPALHGSDISAELFARLADEPLFWAVREASGDVRRLTRIIGLTGDRYALFSGVENLALESLIMGARGWVAGLAAGFPRETLAIWRHASAGNFDEARRLYRWFLPLLDLEVAVKHVQNVKLVETMVIGSNDRCRAPRQPLRGEERNHVEKIIRYALASRAGIALHPPAAE
ncbi:MAG: dihydrodipicolinate synthase family protein, partial [Aestuariivirgaceae bacterium]